MNFIDLLVYMLQPLLLTIVIELSMSLILKIRHKIDILNIIFINCITNSTLSYLMLIVGYLFPNDILVYIFMFIFEILVVVSEFLYYKKNLIDKRINPLLLSIILNLLSVIIGIIILW